MLIAEPNALYQDRPYTLQYGNCGDQGSYIHLTPPYVRESSFVKDFGPKGNMKAIAVGHNAVNSLDFFLF